MGWEIKSHHPSTAGSSGKRIDERAWQAGGKNESYSASFFVSASIPGDPAESLLI